MAAGLKVSLFVLLVACSGSAVATGVGANPIRKVVTLLENLNKKVVDQGKKDEALYNAFICQSETTAAELEAEIAQGKANIEALTASVASGNSELEGLKAQLVEHEASRKQAKDDIATATAIREKEAAAFATQKSDTEQNLAGLKKAVAALEQGQGGSFIQTSAASALKRFAMEKAVMPDATRDEVLAFLSGTQQDDEFAAGSGEITGILKQMGDQMAESLKEATATEAAAVTSFGSLLSAKTKEVDTLTVQIEEEMLRVGEAGVGGAGGANALDDVKEQVEDNTKLLAETESSLKAKAGEYEEAKKALAGELVALADTIKMLSSDDALEMFKKTLPSASASFLQVTVSSASVKARALSVLSRVPRRHLKARPELDLIALALQGKSAGFDEVIGMVDKMVTTLKTEQGDDDSKKDYCNTEFDKAEDKKKEHQLSIEDSETAIEEVKGTIAQKAEEVAALQDSLKKLDGEVNAATEQRKEETADYKETTANNGVAKELLIAAKKKLGAAGDGAKGVIDMIDTIVKDLDKETQEAEVTEKSAQKRFEKFSGAAKEKTSEDSTSLTNAEAAKAEAEEALQGEIGNLEETHEKLMQNEEYNVGLHKECDWLLKNYDMRKQARTAEIDAMDKAKAVLSGADASLLQMKTVRRTRTGTGLVR